MQPATRMLAVTVALVAGALASLQAASTSARNARSPAKVLDDITEHCGMVADASSDFDELDSDSRRSLFEQCSRRILSHPQLWRAIHTPKVELIFKGIKRALAGDGLAGALGETDGSLSREQLESSRVRLSERLERRIAERSYRLVDTVLESFKAESRDSRREPTDMELVCDSHVKRVAPFYGIIRDLAELSQNQSAVGKVIARDEFLFKVILVYQICAKFQGELANGAWEYY